MEDLIRKAKTDPQSFAELYHLHVDLTYRYAFARLQNHSETEEVVSQAWEAILLNIRHLRSDHPLVFKAWMFKILRMFLSRYGKKKKHHLPLENCTQEIKTDEKDQPAALAQKEEEKRYIQKLIQALPKQQQEVVRLRFAADLKNYEIAKILNISEKTVASNLSRALQTLEKNLQTVLGEKPQTSAHLNH